MHIRVLHTILFFKLINIAEISIFKCPIITSDSTKLLLIINFITEMFRVALLYMHFSKNTGSVWKCNHQISIYNYNIY